VGVGCLSRRQYSCAGEASALDDESPWTREVEDTSPRRQGTLGVTRLLQPRFELKGAVKGQCRAILAPEKPCSQNKAKAALTTRSGVDSFWCLGGMGFDFLAILGLPSKKTACTRYDIVPINS